MSVFQAAIDAFDSDDLPAQLLKIWEPIGVSHDRRRIPKQAFDELQDVILEVMTAVCNMNEEQQAAWVLLFDTVYAILFSMYQ